MLVEKRYALHGALAGETIQMYSMCMCNIQKRKKIVRIDSMISKVLNNKLSRHIQRSDT